MSRGNRPRLMARSALGQRLFQELLEQKDYKSLSSHMDIPVETLQKIIRDRAYPSQETAIKIAKALNIPFTEVEKLALTFPPG